MTNTHHERFLYGTIVTAALITYLWHLNTPALSALWIIVGTIIVIAITEAYVEIVDYKITNQRAIDKAEFAKILNIEFDVLRPLLWVVPLFALAHFELTSLNTAYIATLAITLAVLFHFGYHYGTITNKPIPTRILLGLANMTIGITIIAIRYLVK